MRYILQKEPRITVYFPPNWVQKEIDAWLAKWYSSRNLTH